MAPPQLGRDGLLVRRVAEREEEADGDRLRLAELGERVEVERLELALRPEPAADAVAALERHERLRMLGAEAVEVRARLAPQVEQMLEAGVPDVRDAGAAPLEQRVRGDRRPVREARQPGARADRTRRGEHRLLLPRRGRHLGRPDPPLLDEHRVGEGAADVDAQDRHVRTLHRHAGPRLPLRLRRPDPRHRVRRAGRAGSGSTASTATSCPTDLWATLVGTTHAPWDPMAHLEELVGRAARAGGAERAALRARDRADRGRGAAPRDRGVPRRGPAARAEARDRLQLDPRLGRHAPRAARGGGRLGRDLHRRPRPGPREAGAGALPRGARAARRRRRRRRSPSRTRRTASWRRRRPASSASRSRTRSRASSGSPRPAPTSSSTRSPTCRPRPCSAGSRRNRVGAWLHTKQRTSTRSPRSSGRTGSRSATTSGSRPSASTLCRNARTTAPSSRSTTNPASGAPELYYVVDGHATFTVDGDEVDAPAGTCVWVKDPSAKRTATRERAAARSSSRSVRRRPVRRTHPPAGTRTTSKATSSQTSSVRSQRSGRARWPSGSSKPVRSCNPRLGRFDSGAAPLMPRRWKVERPIARRGWRSTGRACK